MSRVLRLQALLTFLLLACNLCLPPLAVAQTAQVCDCDADGDIDKVDINLIANARGKAASGPTDPRDPDRDNKITSADARTCTQRCTFAKCASPTNRPPIADAGPDATVFTGQQVTLDGSDSSDPDGDPLTFAWTFVRKPVGSNAALTGGTTVSPRFTPDVDGVYEIRLIVNDGQVNSAPDTVIITTGNVPPVADAGDDQGAVVNSLVTLDGSGSSDVNGDPLTYSWSFVQRPAGSNATLSSSTAVMPTFTPDRAGIFRLRLIVNDGKVNSQPDEVVIDTRTQPNERPIADAGDDQTVDLNATVTLDGSGSHDPDNGPSPLTYSWSILTRPAGSTAVLSSTTAVRPTFRADKAGEYVIQLIVNDGQLNSAPDTVRITTRNTRPVADAGDDQTGNVGDRMALDGTGSFDADGDPLSYQWSFTSRPTGSTATLATPLQPTSAFTADRAGIYVVQLVVNDGQFDSLPDTATITIAVPAKPVVTITATDANASEAGPNVGVMRIARSGGNNTLALAVALSTSGSSATGSDFTVVPAGTAIPAGAAFVDITFTPVDDAAVEGSEQIVRTINASPNYDIGSPSQATVTIADNDSAPLPTVTVVATDASASEQGANTGTLTISRTGPTTAALLVVGTFSGTAINGTDYSSVSGTVSIPIGQSSVTRTITPIDDTADEIDETVIYDLQAGEYVIGAQDSATVTIADNDTATLPTVTIIATDPAAGETSPNPGIGRFTVTRTGATTSSLIVLLSIGGSATNGSDYQSITAGVTIAAGSATATVDVVPINDSTIENTETVILSVAANAGVYVVGSPGSGQVNIADNDVGALVQFTSTALNIGQNLQVGVRVGVSAGTAPAGGLALRIVSSSPNVLLSASATGAGAQNLNVPMAGGAVQSETFFVHSLASSGTASLTVEIVTTPNPGFSPGTPATVTMTPAGYELLCQNGGCTILSNGEGLATTAQAAPALLFIQAQRLNASTTTNRAGVQEVRGGTTINLPLALSNTNLGVFRANNNGTPGAVITSLSIPAGQNFSYFYFDPNDTSSGNGTITFTKPAGAGTPLNNSAPYAQSMPVTVTGSTPITFNAPGTMTVGRDLQDRTFFLLGAPAPAGGLTVRLTSNNANVLLSSVQTAAGAQTLDVIMTAGSTQSPFVYVQSLAASGTASVSMQVVTTPNPGFTPGAPLAVTLAQSGFQLFCFGGTGTCTFDAAANREVLTTTNSNPSKQLYIEAWRLNPDSTPFFNYQVRGGFAVTVPLALTNSSIGVLRDGPLTTANPISQLTIQGGTSFTYFYFDPNNASTGGNGVINYTKPPTAGTPTTGGQPRRQSVAVTVTQ